MKRRTEAPMEFPLLEVIAFPADPIPVSVIVTGDFEVSGDINLSLGATNQQLVELQRLLMFIVDHLADEMIERLMKHSKGSEMTGGDPPWETTSE